ncbi:MAG: Flp pilus assembly complex ATPase component TadA [Planctomycetaceae bacterium]|nr:Flp pilus assembly complex ATPase component TadA [Planctomycetaceae bacterium]
MGAVISAIPDVAYISLLKVGVMLILVLPWLWTLPWIDHDTRRFYGEGWYWAPTSLAAGGAGLIIWLTVPFFLAGMVVYVVIAASVMLAYTFWHNGRVSEEHQITWSTLAARLRSGGKTSHSVVHAIPLLQYVNIYDSADHLVVPRDDQPPAYAQTYNLVQQFMAEIVRRRASEADITSGGRQAVVRLVVDGEVVDLSKQLLMDVAASEAVIQFLKSAAGMNVEDRRRPQDGAISVDGTVGRMDVRVSCAGTTGGQRMSFLVVQEALRTNMDEVGMSNEVLMRIKELVNEPNGLIIVSGLPRSGITSTMYSILRQYDPFVKQLVTVEMHPRIDLENITQNEYKDPKQFNATLAAVMRRHPDVLLVDRCNDTEASELILRSASERPTLLGLHAGDTFVAMAKWVKLCGSAVTAVKDLRAIICQVLLRKLCNDCKEGYIPDKQMLVKANLTGMDIDQFYRAHVPKTDSPDPAQAIVCPTCGGTGYLGRTAAFEMLDVTDEVRHLVAGGAPVAQIKACARKHKMLYLQEQALHKVVQGVIDVKEVIRATQKNGKG